MLFNVRLFRGNGIELLRCQSPGLLLLDWLFRLYTSTLKPQSLGNQPEGSATNTATKWHFSHGDAVWRDRKDSAGQRDEHWLQCCCLHMSLICGFHTDPKVVAVAFPTGIVMLALPCKSHELADVEQDTCPEQSSAQGPHTPPATNTKSGTVPVPQESWCPITQSWCFLSQLSCQPGLSKLFFPIYLEDSQWLPELPFLPASSLHQLREAFIYTRSEGVLCTVLEILSLHLLYKLWQRAALSSSQPLGAPLGSTAFHTVHHNIIYPAAAWKIQLHC